MPDDSPYTTGGIGLLGTKPSQEAMEKCDTLLMVGTTFPYIEFYPKPGQARGVQIDIDPSASACAIRSRSAWSATAAECLQRSCRCCTQNDDRSFSKSAQQGMKDWTS